MDVREKLWKICILNQVRYYEREFLNIHIYITDLNEQFLLINDPNCHVIVFFMRYKFKNFMPI